MSPMTILWAGLLVLAAVFLRRAIRGRRVGDVPFCGACEYNLTGLQSTTCPECGTTIQDDIGNPITIVHGYRKRSPARVMFASLLMLTALFAFVINITQLKNNWIQFAPTFWVTSLADDGKQDALDELIRRINASSLSAEQISDAIEIGLQIQAAPDSHPLLAEWMDFLGSALIAQQMTIAQESKFFENAVTCTLVPRPVIRSGELLPVEIHYQTRGPSNLPARFGLRAYWMEATTRIGDAHVHVPNEGFSSASILGTTGSGTVTVQGARPVELPPGDYEIVCTANRRVFLKATMVPEQDVPDFEIVDVLRAPIKIIESDAPDLITSTPEPELASTIRKCIAVESIKVFAGKRWGQYFESEVSIGGFRHQPPGSTIFQPAMLPSPPRNLAFRTIIRAGQFEQRLGSARCLGGKQMGHHSSFPLDEENEFIDDLLSAETVTVILRSDVEVARRTVDMTNIWEGEIRFDNVPITVTGRTPKPASSGR